MGRADRLRPCAVRSPFPELPPDSRIQGSVSALSTLELQDGTSCWVSMIILLNFPARKTGDYGLVYKAKSNSWFVQCWEMLLSLSLNWARKAAIMNGNLPGPSNAPLIQIPGYVFVVLCLIIVGIRFGSRIRLHNTLGGDDWTILAALVCTTKTNMSTVHRLWVSKTESLQIFSFGHTGVLLAGKNFPVIIKQQF